MEQTSVADANTGPKKAYIEPEKPNVAADPVVQYANPEQLVKMIDQKQKEMEAAVKELDFVNAAKYMYITLLVTYHI